MAAKSNKEKEKEKEKGTKKSTGRNEAAGVGGAGTNSSSSGGVNTPGGDEFGRAVANTAVAQICEGLGFQGIQRTASETLADIALRYLSDLGKAAHFYANLCGRTECNAFDVILAMEDMGPGSGVDTSTKCLANSSTLRDVMRYVEYAEEIPFARPVPHFPVQKKRAPPPSFAQLGEEPPLPHIPPWLPAFPDPHTYQSTPVWNERKSDPHMDKLEQARQRRKAERSLVSLHLRMSANGGASAAEAQPSSAGAGVGDGVRVSSQPLQQQQQQQQPSGRTILGVAGASPGWGGSGAVAVIGDPQSHSRQQWPSREQEALLAKAGTEGPAGKGKGKRPISSAQNPFLAQPLPAGEKEVAPVALAGRNFEGIKTKRDAEGLVALPSVLEAFAPILEASKSVVEHDESASKSPREQLGSVIPEAKDRVPVSLTFDWGRKARAKAIAAQLSLARSPSPPPLPAKRGKGAGTGGKEEEKDEKKKRAEQILAQAADESEDVTQQI